MYSNKWSTKAGPDGGENACDWIVNKILDAAVHMEFGTNTNFVPSVEAGLQDAEASKSRRQLCPTSRSGIVR